MNTYQGSCHCGNVKFTVEMNLDHARLCDCSICSKRGALNHRVQKHQLALLTPWTDLTLYEWGSKTAKDYFCKTCGVLPFRKPSHPTKKERECGMEIFEGWAVNIRCLEQLDINSVPVKNIKGSEIEIEYS